MSKDFRTGTGDETHVPAIQVCNIVISGALHRLLIPSSIRKRQERAAKRLRTWSGDWVRDL